MNLDGPHPTWPIYKYQPINGNTLGNLAQGKLWASPPSAFNDPFECRLQRADQSDSLSHLRAQNPNLASQSDKELIQMAIARYEKEFAKLGIICFSQLPDNILMWSHYTDHHRGICLGFADSPATPIERAVYPVEYTDDYPALRFDRVWHGDGLARILHAKYSGWKYECELRTMNFDRTGLLDYPAPLTTIIFGLRTTQSDQHLIRTVAAAETSISFMKVTLDPEQYKLHIIPA